MDWRVGRMVRVGGQKLDFKTQPLLASASLKATYHQYAVGGKRTTRGTRSSAKEGSTRRGHVGVVRVRSCVVGAEGPRALACQPLNISKVCGACREVRLERDREDDVDAAAASQDGLEEHDICDRARRRVRNGRVCPLD